MTLRGPALQPGDTIGIVAPASGFDQARLKLGVARLESMAYRVRLGANIHERTNQYFAGTARQRADDLNAMFVDSEVRAIVCARGGYGSQGVLPLLDLAAVRENPKPIVGCSDITALQLWLYQQCGLVSWHGPMVAGDFAREDGVDSDSWTACATGAFPWQLAADSGLQVLREGRAAGKLWGGCLSLMVSTLATPFDLLRDSQEDLVLFLEDIGEKPYRIERMFRQWRDAGKLQRVQGIVFGEMLDCEQPNANYILRDVLHRVLEDFSGPVAIGLRSGHVSRANITLPIGESVELHCDSAATLLFAKVATPA